MPFLIVLSSPSGGGKTTIARTLLEARDDLGYSVSATTRAPRDGERDGVDYFFLTSQEFQRRRDRGEFLECAEYAGHYYGTLEAEVNRILAQGRHVLMDIEVEGGRQVRKRRDDVVSIFILPPSANELLRRLEGRDGDVDGAELQMRMRQARRELAEAPNYDYIVVNQDRALAVSDVAAIIDAEGRRPGRIGELNTELETLRRGLSTLVERLSGKERS